MRVFITVLWVVFVTLAALRAAEAKTIRVAVIDTGYKTKSFTFPICKNHANVPFHYDLTGTGIEDSHGHGNNISHLIDRNAKNVDYCQIIIKYYESADTLTNTINALLMAENLDVDFINYSSSGEYPSEKEKEVIKRLLDKGTTIVVAAGNDNRNLDSACNIYPACYFDNLVVVGNGVLGVPFLSSNRGKVIDFWENGILVNAGGFTMTGTSQAAAIVTGKLIKARYERRPQSEIKRAVRKTARVWFRQSDLRKHLKNKTKYYKKKYLPKPLEHVFPILKAIGDRRVTLTWSF